MRTENEIEKLIDGAIHCFQSVPIPSFAAVKPEIEAVKGGVGMVEYFRVHGYLGQAYDQVGLVVMALLNYKLENLDTVGWFTPELEELLEKWEV